MENITFTLSDLHIYGTAFYDYLKLRKQFFVDTLNWDIPHNDLVEMDQYDNPLAHYSLVLRDGVVLGGMRAMSTTSNWGGYTYLVRDAVAGKLPNIPRQIYESEVSDPEIWECTRLVISEELTQTRERIACLSLILDGLAETARQHGALEFMSLTRSSLVRSLRQLGWQCDRIGESYRSPDDGHRYAVLSMPTEKIRMPEAAH